MHSKWIKRLCALLPLVGTLAALPLSAKAGAVSQGQQNEQRHQNHALPPTPCCTFDIKASLLASSTAWRRSAASAGSSGLPNVHQRHEISLPCLHRPVPRVEEKVPEKASREDLLEECMGPPG
ncbi:unnamed protein product [Durusdinium trenchii]|uniref:Secreted protein n=1 Tax=Durusdinium trenchii TaxID=1381693 RepID=A0ABP0PLE1_9DINO